MAEHRIPPPNLHQASSHTGSQVNAHAGPPHLRQRPLSRSATFAEPSATPLSLRRSSTLSDSVSEARQSIRSSTDDIFLPRVGANTRSLEPESDDESHWHSLPLALALLPAVGGIFFQNGSAILTDLTLLVLAAIFLNWSVRLPWDWYHSAQAVHQREPVGLDRIHDIPEEPDSDDDLDAHDRAEPQSTSAGLKGDNLPRTQPPEIARAASKELHIHELVALASCFIFPLIGSWLLHAIRAQLSRPSEGLVSNYNLTIFLLASEIRPFSHLLKMVQARTLHLQRIVASSAPDEDEKADASSVLDLAKRLEELEAHVAESVAQGLAAGPSASSDRAKDQKQIGSEVRKGIQPDLDALNRAIRRYEKRTALTTFQTESRLQDLETRLKDTTTLAAAAQRGTTNQPRRQGFFLLFSLPMAVFKWVLASITLALQAFWAVVNLPPRVAAWCLFHLNDFFRGTGSIKGNSFGKNGKSVRSSDSTSIRRKNKGKDVSIGKYPRQGIMQQQQSSPQSRRVMETGTFM